MVLGKFKDEVKGRVIKEFIGLMAKLYCVVFHHSADDDDGVDDKEDDDGHPKPKPPPPTVKRAKGVNRGVVERGLSADDYRRCLQQQRVVNTENERFLSRHHTIYTVSVTKRSLAPFDDKRYVIPEEDGSSGAHTLPWGHYTIPPPPSSDDEEEEEAAL